MTINQAAETWNLKKEKILKLIYEEKISDITINDNRIIIPNRKEPFIIPNSAKKTTVNIYKYIVKAIDNDKYLDRFSFGNWDITEDEFDEFINQLVINGYVSKNSNYENTHSTMNLYLTIPGLKFKNDILKSSSKRILEKYGLEIIKLGLLLISRI
ncbi:MAG: hypothetical protein J5994_03205 [Ruminococcus sp.]|nr:hypothetical protein [Ruminococcus sp.]